jgi:hypothetical protein
MKRDSRPFRSVRRTTAPFVLGLLAALPFPAPLQAQAKADTAMDGSWHFRASPYVWATGIDGTLSVTGANEVPVKASFSDIISNFDIGLLGHFEARKDKLGFGLDRCT